MTTNKTQEKFLTEKDEKAIVDTFEFILSGNRDMDTSRRIAYGMADLYKRAHGRMEGSINNLLLGLIQRLTGYNTTTHSLLYGSYEESQKRVNRKDKTSLLDGIHD